MRHRIQPAALMIPAGLALALLARPGIPGAHAGPPPMGARESVLINGGALATLNYDIHEEDLDAFDRQLFDRKSVVFNAAGPGARVIQVDAVRGVLMDDKGERLTKPTRFPNGIAATKKNLEAGFKELARKRPSDVSIVFGDHGSPSGASLWDGDHMTVDEYRSLLSELPQLTTVRSLHLHCYAGGMVARSERKPPDAPGDFSRYALSEFPSNRCALGLSNEKELGQYISWGLHGDQNPWVQLLKGHPKLSLDETKGLVAADARYNVSPMLTSDYLVEDLSGFLCGELKRQDERNANCPDCAGRTEDPSTVALKRICDGTARREFDRANVDVDTADKLEHELALLKADWIADKFFEKDDDAEIYISFMGAKKRVDEVKAKWKVRAPDGPKTKEEYEAKVDELWGGWYEKFFDKYNYFSDHDEGFSERLRKLTPEWLKEKKDEYPVLLENSAALFAQAGADRANLKNTIAANRSAAQKKRKDAWIGFSNERRKAVEGMLKARKYRELKDRYDDIRDCEKGSLR